MAPPDPPASRSASGTPRVEALKFFEAESSLSRPIADATHQIPKISFIIARLTLDTGTVGEGYLLAFHFNPHAIRGALIDVRALASGREVCATGEFNRECDKAFEYFGQGWSDAVGTGIG